MNKLITASMSFCLEFEPEFFIKILKTSGASIPFNVQNSKQNLIKHLYTR